MQKIVLSEVRNLVEYEKVREATRAAVIALKKDRRVSVGENLTFLFENRQTVLFQIQEMVRTERVVDEAKIQEEIDAYNALLPGKGELSATLFIEIPELVHLSQDEVRPRINRFQGLDRDRVALVIGDDSRVSARFEGGHSKEEKMAAVQYLRFPVTAEARAALSDPRRAWSSTTRTTGRKRRCPRPCVPSWCETSPDPRARLPLWRVSPGTAAGSRRPRSRAETRSGCRGSSPGPGGLYLRSRGLRLGPPPRCRGRGRRRRPDRPERRR